MDATDGTRPLICVVLQRLGPQQPVPRDPNSIKHLGIERLASVSRADVTTSLHARPTDSFMAVGAIVSRSCQSGPSGVFAVGSVAGHLTAPLQQYLNFHLQ